jgi:hypothetical protein
MENEVHTRDKTAQANYEPDTISLYIAEAAERDVPEDLEWWMVIGQKSILEAKLGVKRAQDFFLTGSLFAQVVQLRSLSGPDHSSRSIEGNKVVVPLKNPRTQIPTDRDIGPNQREKQE